MFSMDRQIFETLKMLLFKTQKNQKKAWYNILGVVPSVVLRPKRKRKEGFAAPLFYSLNNTQANQHQLLDWQF